MEENKQDIVLGVMDPFQIRLAHGYFPFQQFHDVDVSEKSFKSGTIFAELDMPYGEDPEYMIDE